MTKAMLTAVLVPTLSLERWFGVRSELNEVASSLRTSGVIDFALAVCWIRMGVLFSAAEPCSGTPGTRPVLKHGPRSLTCTQVFEWKTRGRNERDWWDLCTTCRGQVSDLLVRLSVPVGTRKMVNYACTG